MVASAQRSVTLRRDELPPAIPVFDPIDFNNNYEAVSQVEDPSGKEAKVSAYPNENPNQGLLGQGQNQDKNMITGVTLCFVLCLIFCQLPFTIVNIVFAQTQPHSVCMDTPHAGLTVRPWLMGIGITEIVLMVIILLPVLFFKCGCCGITVMGGFLCGAYALWALKGLIWFVVELVMFITGISKYCHGGVYTYGLVLVILNGLGLIAGCCKSCQGNQ